MRLYHRLKLRSKLIFGYINACLIPLLLALLFIYSAAISAIDSSTLKFATAMNSQIAANMEDFLDSFRSVTIAVLIDNDILSQMDDENVGMAAKAEDQSYIRRILFRVITMQPGIISAGIVTDSGTSIQVGSSGEKISLSTLMAKEWMRDLPDERGNMTVIPLHRFDYSDRGQERSVITIVQRLSSFSGRNTGMLILDIDPDSMISLGEEFQTTSGSYQLGVSVSDSQGRLLWSTDYANLTYTDDSDFLTAPAVPSCYRSVSGTTASGNTVLTVFPESTLVMNRSHVTAVTVIACQLCLLIAFVFSGTFSRAFTRPIIALRQGMKRVEDGQYEKLSFRADPDEMGELVASYDHMVEQMKQLIDREYVAQIQRKDAQLMALQTQINPHMLFNTLEIIRMKALLGGNREVAQMAKLLARMFRTSLDAGHREHTIADELDYVRTYMALQDLRNKGRFELQTDIPEELLGLPCPVILFQPLVENAIEHGAADERPILQIRIDGQQDDDEHASFYVTDNGTGAEPAKLMRISDQLDRIAEGSDSEPAAPEEERVHIGLENIARRIQLQYGSGSYLKIIYSNSDQGTCICIHIRTERRPKKGAAQ